MIDESSHNIEYDLLRFASTIEANDERLEIITKLARKVNDWQVVISNAETDGIAPILYKHLLAANFPLENAVKNQFRALAIRHRHATPTRIRECVRISDLLDTRSIPSVALKGIALANDLYPKPELRPMRDIDLLIPHFAADAAKSIVIEAGYKFELDQPSRFMAHHHHLPNASKLVDDLLVSLELHIDAISGDAPGSMRYDRLLKPPRVISSNYGELRVLDHIDMMNQLSRHALEPGTRIKLMSVMDILGYANKYFSDIDWPILERKYPYLPVFLGLLDFVTTLPAQLRGFILSDTSPSQIGELIPTLRSLNVSKITLLKACQTLSSPPEWWFRSYYGVKVNHRSRISALIEHRLRTIFWITTRLLASI